MQLLRATILIGLSLGLLTSAWAETPLETRIKGANDGALDVIYGDCCRNFSDEEQRERICEILEKEFDLEVIVRRTIGRNWRKLSVGEQTEIVDLVKRLVVKVLYEALKENDRPDLSYGDAVEVAANRAEVPLTVTANGQTYYLIYKFGRLPSGWEIIDIVAEDISFVSNYRQQMDDHFRKKDGADLVAKLEDLLNSDNNEDIKL